MQTPADLDIPPELMRRLKFRAYSQHRSLESEIIRCLNLGLQQEERPQRFRDRARSLRQHARGVLTAEALRQHIENGRS